MYRIDLTKSNSRRRICSAGNGHVSLGIMPRIESDDAHTPRTAESPDNSYVLTFQEESFHHKTRYHWMVCGAQNPDELVSWGHAPSQELAEAAARGEVNDLSSGLSQGGHVISMTQAFSNRRSLHR